MVNRLVRKATMMTGTLVLFVGMYGCNSTSTGAGTGAGDDDGNDNANAPCTDLTYENFVGTMDGFMATYCTTCHSSALTGAERQGATEGIDFDTMAGVVAQLNGIRERAVEAVQDGDGSPMPPQTADAFPTADEVDQLAEWIGCEAQASPSAPGFKK
ncbi:MAG: hypothetical protein IID37_08230 [Planctomycetes bacterium]|nr:hypothetical protein [Planctomycetota bacterium]